MTLRRCATAALLASLALAAPAAATTRTVSNTHDSGAGSLRDTIAASNDLDKVVVPAGTYTVATQIPISKSILVEGEGAGATKIGMSGAPHRIFALQGTPIVTLSKLALKIDYHDPGGLVQGAGVQAPSGSSLRLADVVISGVVDVSGDSSGGGGSIYGGAIYATSSLNLQRTRIDGMHVSAAGGPGGNGGFIESLVFCTGPLTVDSSSISSNAFDAHGTGATGTGGSLYGAALYHSSSSAAVITDSVFDRNTSDVSGSGTGAGGFREGTLFNSGGDLTLTRVSASHNTVDLRGGSGGASGGTAYGVGLYHSGANVTAERLSASGNSVIASGGGGHNGGFAEGVGAFSSTSGTASFKHSRFEGNSADVRSGLNANAGTSYGTGLYASGGSLTFERSSASGNTADARGVGPTAHGNFAEAAGMYASGTLTLTDSTVANNTANASGSTPGTVYGAGLYAPSGGGLVNATIAGNRALNSGAGVAQGGNVYVSGTLHAKNTIVSEGQAATKPNCTAALTSDGHNIEDKDECGFHAGGDKFNTDPKLGALADNGGLSLTRRLLPGSPAIDKGDNAGCPSTDQRDFARIGTCDVGAYEFTPSDLALTMTAPAKVGIGAQIDYALTLKNNGPQSSFGTTVVDTLGAGLAPAAVNFPGAACTLGQVTSCPLGTVAGGQTRNGHVTATATALGAVKATAGFTTFSDDANAANNTASVTTKVVHVSASKLKVPKKVKLGKKLPQLQPAKKKKAKKQYIAFKLNGPATVTLTFQKREGKKYKKAGKLKVAGHQGKNKLRFAGRLSKKKKLKPGRYRVALVAVDLTGHKSKKVKRSFKVVRK